LAVNFILDINPTITTSKLALLKDGSPLDCENLGSDLAFLCPTSLRLSQVALSCRCALL